MRRLQVKVKPNARQSALTQLEDGSWKATLAAPPHDGKANEELIRLAAAHFGLRKTDIRLKAGAASRNKWLELPD